MDTAVLFWWENEFHLVEHNGEVHTYVGEETREPLSSILALISKLEVKPYSIRLIYHSSKMDMHPVSCPKPPRYNARRVMTKVLKADHPVIESDSTVHAYDRISPSSNAYGSLLYIDPASQLLKVVSMLQEQGLKVDGAWPISAVFEAWSEASSSRDLSGVIGLFFAPQHALVYWRSQHGERSARAVRMEQDIYDVQQGTLAALKEALSVFDQSGNTMVVLSRDPVPDNIGTFLQAQRTTFLPFSEMATIVDGFSHDSLGNFVSQGFCLSRKQTHTVFMWAGGVLAAFGLLFCVAGFLQRLKIEKLQSEAAANAASCKTDIDAFTKNKTEIDAINVYLASAKTTGVPAETFLSRINNGVPVEILIHRVRIDKNEFTVNGTNFGDPELFSKFVDTLVKPNDPWHLDDASAAAAHRSDSLFSHLTTSPATQASGPDFSIHGYFRTDNSVPLNQ